MKRTSSMLLPVALTLALVGAAFAGGVEDAIKDLGSDDFQKREAATAALSNMGDEAKAALEKAAQDKDPEVRWRAERALQSIRARGGKAAGASEKKASTPAPATPATPPPGQEKIPAPSLVPDALEGARQRLRSVEEELKRQRPQLGELFKGFGGGQDLFGGDFGKVLEEMERRFRDLDVGGRAPSRRDFWTFQWKDGQWQILRGDDSGAAKAGLTTSAAPPVLRAQLRLEGEPDGRVVDDVRAGSPAELAGLRKFDLILRIDGAAILEEDDLEALASPGDHKLAIVRTGERRELLLTAPAEPKPEEKRAPEAQKKRAPEPPPAEPTEPAPPAKKDGLRRDQ